MITGLINPHEEAVIGVLECRVHLWRPGVQSAHVMAWRADLAIDRADGGPVHFIVGEVRIGICCRGGCRCEGNGEWGVGRGVTVRGGGGAVAYPLDHQWR